MENIYLVFVPFSYHSRAIGSCTWLKATVFDHDCCTFTSLLLYIIYLYCIWTIYILAHCCHSHRERFHHLKALVISCEFLS